MSKEYEYSNTILNKTTQIDCKETLDLRGSSFHRVFPYTQNIIEETPYNILSYPEHAAYSLCEKIAEFEEETVDNILVGNGTSELLYSMLATISPKSVLLIGPLSEKYARICTALSIPYTLYSLQSKNTFMFTVQDAENIAAIQCEMTIVCSPNAISGALLSIPLLMYSISSPWFLLDLSCREFMYNTEYYSELFWSTLRPMVRQGVHLVTLHNFTHFFCAQGMPLAYIVAQKKHISFFAQKRSAYTIAPFTVCVGKKMLQAIPQYRAELPNLVQDTYTLLSTLSEYPFFSEIYFSKEIGFLSMAIAKEYTAIQIYEYLLSRNIIVTLFQASTGMPPTMIRVCAMVDMSRFYEALNAFMVEK